MQDLRKVFMVLASGVAAAFLLTTFFVSYYGPSGTYQLKQTLLNPETLATLNYNDWNPKISEQDRFIFDQVRYEVNGRSPRKVTVDQYKKIYQLLSGDTSSKDNQGSYPASSPKLTLYVKTESPSKWQAATKIFQQLQIDDSGDYYRVELHEDNVGTHWVEFPHKNVKNRVEEFLND